MAQRYVRNIETGRIYPYADILAARKDMVECDAEGNYPGMDRIAAPEDKAVPISGKAKFLKQLETGRVFVWTEILAQRKDMVPWSGEVVQTAIPMDDPPAPQPVAPQLVPEEPKVDVPVPDPPKPSTTEPEVNTGPTLAEKAAERMARIKDAVKTISPEKYVAARFNRPAMPKIADVEQLSGLSHVKADEILVAMKE